MARGPAGCKRFPPETSSRLGPSALARFPFRVPACFRRGGRWADERTHSGSQAAKAQFQILNPVSTLISDMEDRFRE